MNAETRIEILGASDETFAEGINKKPESLQELEEEQRWENYKKQGQ